MACAPVQLEGMLLGSMQHRPHVSVRRAGAEGGPGEGPLAERLLLLHQMLGRLLAGGCAREAEAVAGGMAAAARLLQGRPLVRRMAAWALEACQDAPEVRAPHAAHVATPCCTALCRTFVFCC